MRASAAWRVRLVVHPLTILSVVLLAANDAWFKAWWPGLVTGKLSDVAGVWMVGALVVAATGSVRWGSALTALGFALLKTVPAVAVLAAPLLGGVTLRDPTDLVALLVLWSLGRLANRLGAQRTKRANDAWSVIGAVFVAVAATLATTATSCAKEPEVTHVALSAEGTPMARYRDNTSIEGDGWYELTDDGPQYRPEILAEWVGSTQACVSAGCYRVEPGAGVFLDAELIYEYTPAQRINHDQLSSCFQTATFESIVAVEGADGVDLWVSMGVSGVLHRDTSGLWEGIPVRDAIPPADETPEPPADHRSMLLYLLPLVLAVVLAIALPLSCRSWRRSRLLLVTAAAVVVNVGWAVVGYVWMADQDLGVYPRSVGPFIFVWVAPWVILQLVWVAPVLWRRRRKPPGYDPTSWESPPSPPSASPPPLD